MVPFFLVLILCRQKLLITGAGEGPIIWGAQPLRVAEWRWVNAGGGRLPFWNRNRWRKGVPAPSSKKEVTPKSWEVYKSGE